MSERIRTAQNVALDLNVAGIGERILAALLDYAIIYATLLIFFLCFGLIRETLELSETVFFVLLALLIIPLLFYFLAFELFFDGQTPGKRALKVRVVTTKGGVPTLRQYLLRWLMRLVDVHFFATVVGISTIVFSRHNQRVGDMVADTLVVKEEKAPSLSAVRQRRTPDEYGQLTYPQVDRLSPQDIATAREVYDLVRDEGLTPQTKKLCRKLRDVFTEKMQTETPPTESDRLFLKTIIHDYEAFHSRGTHAIS